eukprot:c25685_g1_i1.p2 GENE.c25685_g1_i1~~c25685_g1_i1.p2  ORF type:complete len:583 (-),score=127.43 c25685_g1_i1:117-1865(-)
MATASTIAPHAHNSLYVGDLSAEVTENTLYEIFATHVGNVSSIRVCRDANTRRSLGYAYVNFTDPASAENAILTLNYSLINDKPCRIMWSRRDPASRKNPKANVFVKNLEKSIDNKTLHDLFSSSGEVLSCKIMTDEHGKSRGFAYVHFTDVKGAEAAIAQHNGVALNDQPVTVMHFTPRKERGGAAESTFTNVFFKSLPAAWTKDDFERYGAEAGAITSAYLAVDDAGASRMFGFLNYGSNAEAKRAVELFNGRAIAGQEKPLFASRAMRKAERERVKEEAKRKFVNERRSRTQFSNVYIKNLSDDVTDEALSKAFSAYGAVSSAKVMRGDDNVSKGFGFVCFTSTDEATSAITALNGHTGVLGTKPLYVALAEAKQQRVEKLRQQSQHKANASFRGAAGAAGAAPGGYMPPTYGPGFMGYGGGFAQARPGYVAGYGAQPPAGSMQGQPRGFPAGAGAAGGRGAGRMPYAGQPMAGMPMARGAVMQPAGFPPAGQQAAAAARRLDIRGHLATLAADAAKQFLGEHIYPVAREAHGEDAGKITGMLLELPNEELVKMLENPPLLREKIAEAYRVAHESRPAA